MATPTSDLAYPAIQVGLLVCALVALTTIAAHPPAAAPQRAAQYPLHRDITATVFWVGEPASPDSGGISNAGSVWVSDWVGEFGGVDTPTLRCGYNPCGFTPQENAFYVALPFSDYTAQGTVKPVATLRRIPWYRQRPQPHESLVKNRWVAISYGPRTVYGQWEDAGPALDNDTAYVFGTARPQAEAGLDVSPAINIYLGLQGKAVVSWQFVDAAMVPPGPWRQTITTSGIRY